MAATRNLAPVAACLGLLLVLAAACTLAADPGTAQEREFDRLFGTCLSKAGYDASLDNLAERRQSDPAFDKAVKDCATSVGRTLFPQAESDKTVRDQIRCMRAAGWDLPEPKPDEHGALTLQGVEDNVPRAQRAAFEADYAACIDRLTSPTADEHQNHDHDH